MKEKYECFVQVWITTGKLTEKNTKTTENNANGKALVLLVMIEENDQRKWMLRRSRMAHFGCRIFDAQWHKRIYN